MLDWPANCVPDADFGRVGSIPAARPNRSGDGSDGAATQPGNAVCSDTWIVRSGRPDRGSLSACAESMAARRAARRRMTSRNVCRRPTRTSSLTTHGLRFWLAPKPCAQGLWQGCSRSNVSLPMWSTRGHQRPWAPAPRCRAGKALEERLVNRACLQRRPDGRGLAQTASVSRANRSSVRTR